MEGRACRSCRLHQLSAVFLLFLVTIAAGAEIQATAYLQAQGKVQVKLGVLDKQNGDAVATYDDRLTENGWGVLNVVSGFGPKKLSDNDIMYLAGYLEGVLTQERIYQHYLNLYGIFFMGKSEDLVGKVKKFYTAQDTWVRAQVKQSTDPVMEHLSYILSQYDGLVKGYNDNVDPPVKLDIFAFQLLNGNGDTFDIIPAVNPSSRPDFSNMSRVEIDDWVLSHSHCSALIKVLGAYENVYMSHSSWFNYAATMRIYKHYNFNIANPATATRKMSFSSYPGYLESLDDFYLMDSGLVMLQTTNNVFNGTLYDLVKPESILAWQRVRTANMLARNGDQWGAIMNVHNSGTYNNQYMIIDLNLIELGKTIHDGALYVVEQIPGLVMSADQTDILRAGYWPSYNIPFYEKVYNLSGYPEFAKSQGLDYTYQLAPRAKIFRRDAGKVKDMESMKAIMRYNDYLHDPYSKGNPCSAICCRKDLAKVGAKPDGCYDTKVSDYHMARNLTSFAINGPTLGTGLEPFSWSDKFKISHIGLPNVYNFSFVTMTPAEL
ncbi:phospholipase B-like 1 [Branchiostoma floridae x Branchiostoma japonicum]